MSTVAGSEPQKKSRIGVNTVANLVGSASSALINMAVVPTYLRLLGMEAFGLIGVNASIGLIVGLADFGLAPTLMRELAREWKDEQDILRGRTVLETLNRVYLPLALLLGGAVVIAAPYLARFWVNTAALPIESVETSIRLIGLTASFQLLTSFYSAGLSGLQRQVLANIFGITIGVAQAGGSIILLKFFGVGIVGFFVWQAAVLGVAAVVMGVTLFALVPGRGAGAGFQKDALRALRPFALGMSGISLLSIVLTQTDKVFLTRVLSLDEFGYYSLAAMIAMSLRKVFGPLFLASYPRFTEIVRRDDPTALERAYRLVSQAMAVLVIPATLLMLFYASEAVFTWTGNGEVADRVSVIVAVLVAAAGLTGVTQTPYAIQLAHGWTRLALLTNAGAAIVFVPAVMLLGQWHGAVGVAFAVLGLNLVYLLIQTPLMHLRILRGGFGRWALRDTLLPGVFAALPIVAIAPLMSAVRAERVMTGVVLVAGYMLSVGFALAGASELRAIVWRRLRRS